MCLGHQLITIIHPFSSHALSSADGDDTGRKEQCGQQLCCELHKRGLKGKPAQNPMFTVCFVKENLYFIAHPIHLAESIFFLCDNSKIIQFLDSSNLKSKALKTT